MRGSEGGGRKGWSSAGATLAVSLWCVALCNAAFWGQVWQVRGGFGAANLAFLAAVFVVATLYLNLLLTLLTFPIVGRPLLALVLLIASAVAHFSSTLGVGIDRHMIRNVVETDVHEAGELVGWRLLATIALLGLVPAALLLRRRIEYGSVRSLILGKLGVAALSLLALLPIAAVFYADFASLLRNHRELRYLFAPANFLDATASYVEERCSGPRLIAPLGRDARKGPASAIGERPMLLLLVIGETARGANFSLGGYERPTNPELAQRDVLYFSDVRSAGTCTAVSLPCMLSNLGHGGSTAARARKQESLLDVLAHAGFDVWWRDNDSGCKGACDRVESEDVTKKPDPKLCPDGSCWDEILLEGIQERLDRADRDLAIVLHMQGSHGPGYHLRHPPEFEVFGPECKTLELGDCSHDELVNAYDNTILYTDHVLARAIDLLDANAARFDAAMLYVSDHGESLGEHGLYLHGVPMWMAPDEQTRVPWIVWAGAGFRARRGLDWAALADLRGEPWSHDDLFHSVLGLLDVRTEVYRPELDIFRSTINVKVTCPGGSSRAASVAPIDRASVSPTASPRPL